MRKWTCSQIYGQMEEVNAVVSGIPSKTIGTFCLLLKEIGCRPGEAWMAEWTDIDLSRNTIVIRPEKGSRNRGTEV